MRALPGAWVVRLSTSSTQKNVHDILRALAQDSDFEYAEPDQWRDFTNLSRYEIDTSGSVGSAAGSIDARRPNQQGRDMNLAGIPAGVTGAGINVAVVGTGMLPQVNTGDNVVAGWDFTTGKRLSLPYAKQINSAPSALYIERERSSSGDYPAIKLTRDAAVAFVTSEVGHVIRGIAPGAKVMPLKVVGPYGARDSDIIDAIAWSAGLVAVPKAGRLSHDIRPHEEMARRARVILLPLGGLGPCPQSYRQLTRVLSGQARAVVLIAAAGDGKRNSRTYAPANCPGVINVAAMQADGSLAAYSNYGAVVTLTAPGDWLEGKVSQPEQGGANRKRRSLHQEGHLALSSGSTATAAAHVAAIVTLMLSVSPTLTADEVKRVLVSTARAPAGNCPGCSAGTANAGAAVKAVMQLKARGVSLLSKTSVHGRTLARFIP